MKHPKTGLWTLLTDALLLFLALVSAAFGVVSAYHIKVLPPALWGGAAVFALAALTLVNLPRYRLPLTLAVGGLWAWGLWWLWEPLVWGGTRIQCDVVNTIAAKLPNVTAIAPAMELPDALWPQVTTLWLLMVGAAYALFLALAMCRLRYVPLTILWLLLPILPALCVTEATDSLPALGLLAVWLTLILTSLTDRRDPNGTARLRPVALICVAGVLAMLARSLPTQGTAQPVWAADLRSAALADVNRMDLSALLSRWSGWMGSGSTEYMNLLGSGPARTGRTALRVQCARPGKFYLRGHSADVYTGRRWEPLKGGAEEELEAIREGGTEPLLLLGEKSRLTRVYYSNGYWESRENRTWMVVENVAAPGGCVYYPYALAALPENAAFGGDSHLERAGGVWEHKIFFYPNWQTAYADGVYDVAYRDYVYDHELQVPDDLRPILEDWLMEATEEALGRPMVTMEDYLRYAIAYQKWEYRRWLAFSSSSYVGDHILYWTDQPVRGNDVEIHIDAVDDTAAHFESSISITGPTQEEIDAVDLTSEDLGSYYPYCLEAMLDLVVNRLADTTVYDRNTSAPPADRDYVDWFLNESRQGYCMHYATAATLLLRTAGIPARYVSGYVADVPHTGEAEVTDHAAHAWVEIFREGLGWMPLEVTPGYQGNAMGDIPALEAGEVQPTAVPSAAPSSTPDPTPTPTAPEEDEPTPTPSAAPTPSAEPEAPTGPGDTPVGTVAIPAGAWYVLGALFLLALLVRGRRYALDRRRRRLRGEDANAAVLYAYRCHKKLKSWGGRESEELTALAEKAKFSQHTLTEAEQERALHILKEEKRRTYIGLPGWKKPLLRLLWGSTEW